MRAPWLATVVLIGCSGGPMMPNPGTVTVDPAKCSLAVDTTTVVADSMTQLKATATIRDTNDKPVQGASVTFTLSGTGNSPGGAQGTQQDGTAMTFFASTKAETKTLTARVDLNGVTTDLTQQVTVTFVPGPAMAVRFLVQPTTTRAGEVITPAPTLEVTDGHGNPTTMGDATASVRLVRSTGGTVQNGGPTTSVNGVITFSQLIINRPQQGYALRAEMANGAADESVQFDVTLGDYSAATSSFTANPTNVVADNTSTTTLTLTVKDKGNNPLPNVNVTFSATGTGHTFGSTTATTGVDGVATTILKSSVAEMKTVTATFGADSMTTGVTFIP